MWVFAAPVKQPNHIQWNGTIGHETWRLCGIRVGALDPCSMTMPPWTGRSIPTVRLWPRVFIHRVSTSKVQQ